MQLFKEIQNRSQGNFILYLTHVDID